MIDIDHIWYHQDYDGLVAAAMLQACAPSAQTHPLEFSDNYSWPTTPLPARSAVLDFPFHPAAALWVDHHATAFSTEALQKAAVLDAFHILDTSAASCPEVIVQQPWFRPTEPIPALADWVAWSMVIDAARYQSANDANDLRNPHILLALVIPACRDPQLLSQLVTLVRTMHPEKVVSASAVAPIAKALIELDLELRPALSRATGMQGAVAFLDQSFTTLPFRRYLPYEIHPTASYAVGIYPTRSGFVVSVGENPWQRSGAVDLGALCKPFGGGGRMSTAGVPTSTLESAQDVAAALIRAINAVHSPERRPAALPLRSVSGCATSVAGHPDG